MFTVARIRVCIFFNEDAESRENGTFVERDVSIVSRHIRFRQWFRIFDGSENSSIETVTSTFIVELHSRTNNRTRIDRL